MQSNVELVEERFFFLRDQGVFVMDLDGKSPDSELWKQYPPPKGYKVGLRRQIAPGVGYRRPRLSRRRGRFRQRWIDADSPRDNADSGVQRSESEAGSGISKLCQS